MFLIAGILLLSIIYLLTAQALQISVGDLPFKLVQGHVQATTGWCRLPPAPTSDQYNVAMAECLQQQRDLALDDLLRRSLFALLGLSIIAFAFGYAMARPGAVPAGPDHPHRPPGGGSDLSRRIELRRPGRRAEGARRHVRRDAGAAGAGLHGPAAVRRQRLARAAHPAGDQPHPAGGAPVGPGRARGAARARQDAAGHQRAQRAAGGGSAAARPQRQPDRRAQARRPGGGGGPCHRAGARGGRRQGRGPAGADRPRRGPGQRRAAGAGWP